MPFKFERTYISDVLIIEPKAFNDERGFFFENYKQSEFERNEIKYTFKQDNSSFSETNVVRGLHFQRPPYEQGKLVRVINGRILDVAVDIRIGSPTYGKYLSVELSGENKKMLWIPPGFAHGFVTYEKSFVHYKVTNEYNKESESGIIWNDPSLNIDWNAKDPQSSDKDKQWPKFKDLKGPFKYGVF